jgi:hypothetical protein
MWAGHEPADEFVEIVVDYIVMRALTGVPELEPGAKNVTRAEHHKPPSAAQQLSHAA